MSGYLLKRRAIQAWPDIIRRSRIHLLWEQKEIPESEAVSSVIIS